MEIDSILCLPGIIDRILLNSDFATIVALISLSKSWHEAIHNRATWVSIGRQKGFYISKNRSVVPPAHLLILSQEHIHERKCVPLQFDNKLDSNNPREQINELNSLLSQLNDNKCPLLASQITLIIDTNMHVLNSTHPKVPLLFIDLVLKIVERKSPPLTEVLLDALKPQIVHVISMYPKSDPVHQAILEITAKALPFYRKRAQLIEEFAKKDVITALVSHVVKDNYKLYKAAGDILYWILSDIDRHIDELSPLLEELITSMKNRDITFPLEGLSRSRNVSIWSQVLTCFQKVQYNARWMTDSLRQVFKDSPELFQQISGWECTAEYLPEVWLSVLPQDFMNMAKQYDDWLKIRYAQCILSDRFMTQYLVERSDDNAAVFDALCFVAVNTGANTEMNLEKNGFLEVIGSKTKSKNSAEAKTARDTVQKLMKKPKLTPVIAQELKNKTIVLY